MKLTQAAPVNNIATCPSEPSPDLAWPARSFSLLLLFLIAVLPRTIGLADFLTYDEAYHWIGRTERFAAAILHQQWDETRQTGHPGVTLMWLGSLGLAIEHLATTQDWATVSSEVEHLAWMRLPSAILHAMLAAGSLLLLRRLLPWRVALLAALLWAADPYLVAHARLLHLDALLTDFVTLSLLCVLLSCRSTRPAAWLVGGGVLAGLALLTKGPALILLPVAGILMFWQNATPTFLARLRSSLGAYLLWLGVALVVVLLLWPAMWVTPHLAIERYIQKILWEGGYPFVNAQFFFGYPVGDPGVLFYPVADVFRMTPIVLVGVLALVLVAQHPSPERTLVALLAAFIIGWTLVMTAGAKKFDRYVLPTWPALLVLAAVGWHALLVRIQKRTAHPLVRFVPWGLVSLLLLAVVLSVAQYHPYYLSYYNPLVGGGEKAQQVMLVGWGEGMDQAGDYLRTRPDIGYAPVLSDDTRLLEPFVPVPVKHLSELGEGLDNYAVIYRPSLQRNLYPEQRTVLEQTIPLHRVRIHGIDYALIYQLARPFAQPLDAWFGESLHLRGITIQQQEHQIIVTPSWDVRAVPAADYWVFLHLVDTEGTTIAQTDIPPGGTDYPPTSTWQPGQQIAVPLPLLLPENTPAGTYQLRMGVYHTATRQRLDISHAPPPNRLPHHPDMLLLHSFTLSPAHSQP
jgi:hypothetical protein